MLVVKRLFDVFFSLLLLIALGLPMAFIAVLVLGSSRGGAFYWSVRVGKDNVLFSMPKFRTMTLGTPAVATHLLSSHDQHLTKVGRILRRTSLDELPQLWSILKGDMSFVGPRPALYNQDDLIALRKAAGVDWLLPGLTGWAQINGRDALSILEKVSYDAYYAHHQSFYFDLMILVRSMTAVVSQRGVAH